MIGRACRGSDGPRSIACGARSGHPAVRMAVQSPPRIRRAGRRPRWAGRAGVHLAPRMGRADLSEWTRRLRPARAGDVASGTDRSVPDFLAHPACDHPGRPLMRADRVLVGARGRGARDGRRHCLVSFPGRPGPPDRAARQGDRVVDHDRIRRRGRTEGPAAQVELRRGVHLRDLLRVNLAERRILVLAGMSAGLAAIFRAPLGMAIFAGRSCTRGSPSSSRRCRTPWSPR